ncbi:hypothetical protein CL617_02875 [archaeon]|nr:hypothetical protein [archaeon]|tara:strand:- start:2430 stop:2942 length:513 start_codon:yes stop_codon:yes gene_type:complete
MIKKNLGMHKEQRVGIFVDVQNIYYSAKNLYKSKANFNEIMKIAVGNRKLIRALAYTIKTEEMKEKTFFDALEKIGFEVKAKDLQIFVGGMKKGDWDVGIATDAIELSAKLDVVVLVSGDGDFVPLVEHLQKVNGCRVEVITFGKSCSAKLIESADNFYDLDEQYKRFLR